MKKVIRCIGLMLAGLLVLMLPIPVSAEDTAAYQAPAAYDIVAAYEPDSAIYPVSGALTGGAFLHAAGDNPFTVDFNVPVGGEYYLWLRYRAAPGGGEIVRRVDINGEPIVEVTLKRYYRDKNQNYKTQIGNQTFPPQIEVERQVELPLESNSVYENEPYAFLLAEGLNAISLGAVEGDILVEGLTLTPATPPKPYAAYAVDCANAGLQKVSNFYALIQAQDAACKTSPGLYPVNDRTSPLVEPYHPSNIVLNSIGGYAWRFPGQSIEWTVDAPEDGLYKIAFNYKQSYSRGMFTTRALRINGQVPFAEAYDLRFNYDTDFNAAYLADRSTGEPYYFHLKKGINAISLEASVGVFAEIAGRVEQSVRNLNQLYQDIIVITSTSPDKYRDYQLYTLLPDMIPRMRAEQNQLTAVVNDINSINVGFANSTAVINRLIANLGKIIGNQKEIASYLGDFKNSLTATGDWVVSISEQPLLLERIIIASDGQDLPQARATFWQKLLHNVRAFVGSFTTDHDSERMGETGKTIEVWVSTGRDQYNVLKQLISESFDPSIRVILKLVNPDAIFPATLTGVGPDINLQVAASTPINFGYRDGAYNLTQFPDFEEVATRFAPAAVDTFRFMDACYALPDQMSFNMLFYRTDIFEGLGLSVPETMDEFLAIVPILQKNNMDIYFSTTPQATLGAVGSMNATRNINAMYLSLLYQMGGALYEDNGARASIVSDTGFRAFKYWTELYTKHNFIVETDFQTRFRMGEIPVGIVDLNVYNYLSAMSPEIRGQWAMAQIPGYKAEDGTIRRDVPVSVSGSLIVKNIAEKNNTVNECWSFLKWWTSAETQYQYAVNMESVLGLAGRYPVANLEAFTRIPWGSQNLEVLKNTLAWTRAVPQVPGSYITGRVLDNAFLSVVAADVNANPTDAIFRANDQINDELASKRREFGITN